MLIKLLLPSLVLTSLSLTAQNWVSNGDFSAGLTGWTQTGYSYNPMLETWDVTGMGASACFACSPGGQVNPPPFPPQTLDQTVTIIPGIAYEISADLASTVVLSPSTVLDLLTVTAKVAGAQVAKVTFGMNATSPLPKEWRARLCARFVSTAAGSVPLSFEFARGLLANANTARTRIDNISLQIAVGPTFNLDGPRRINKSINGIVDGTPSSPYVVFLAAAVLPAGLQIPGVSGLWFLDPVTTATLIQGTLDATGRASVAIPIPNITYLTQAPVWYQPAQIVSSAAQLGFHHGGLFTL